MEIINVKRITDYEKDRQILNDIWEFYERRIPADELVNPINIIEELKSGGKNQYFIVATILDKVGAFLWFTYNPQANFPFAFISYLVLDDTVENEYRGLVVNEILDDVKEILSEELVDCRGLIAEVDDPLFLNHDQKRKKKAEARIKLFKIMSRKIGTIAIEIDNCEYKQPDLTGEGNVENEISLRLLFFPNKFNKFCGDQLSIHNKIDLVSGVYDEYLSGQSDSNEFSKPYNEYISDLKSRVLKTIK